MSTYTLSFCSFFSLASFSLHRERKREYDLLYVKLCVKHVILLLHFCTILSRISAGEQPEPIPLVSKSYYVLIIDIFCIYLAHLAFGFFFCYFPKSTLSQFSQCYSSFVRLAFFHLVLCSAYVACVHLAHSILSIFGQLRWLYVCYSYVKFALFTVIAYTRLPIVSRSTFHIQPFPTTVISLCLLTLLLVASPSAFIRLHLSEGGDTILQFLVYVFTFAFVRFPASEHYAAVHPTDFFCI